MADIASSESKVQVEETDFNSAVSEALAQKLGGNINKLIDNLPIHFELKTSSGTWTCPDGVDNIILIGVGGGCGGGGGCEGSDNLISGSPADPGSNGTVGTSTVFGGVTIAQGGSKVGQGGQFLVSVINGRSIGHDGASSSDLSTRSPGLGATGYTFNGTTYGGGGAGGDGGNDNVDGRGGAGGGRGGLGFRVMPVVPATIYSFTIGAGGAGGAGGSGNAGDNGDPGSSGQDGALLIIY
jgi:hypothetical protein